MSLGWECKNLTSFKLGWLANKQPQFSQDTGQPAAVGLPNTPFGVTTAFLFTRKPCSLKEETIRNLHLEAVSLSVRMKAPLLPGGSKALCLSHRQPWSLTQVQEGLQIRGFWTWHSAFILVENRTLGPILNPELTLNYLFVYSIALPRAKNIASFFHFTWTPLWPQS